MAIQDINFADPTVWIIVGVILVVIAFILVYFKFLSGETLPRPVTEE